MTPIRETLVLVQTMIGVDPVLEKEGVAQGLATRKGYPGISLPSPVFRHDKALLAFHNSEECRSSLLST